MGRDDYNRRVLRGLFDRNQRRASALADARDSRRHFDDEEAAPRRLQVSRRATRMDGFGRGGVQVVRVVRLARRHQRPLRFADESIYRRGHRDRFVREDDFAREDRRERFLERRSRRGSRGFGDRRVEVIEEVVPRRRFGGFSRRRRLQIREREERRGGGGGRMAPLSGAPRRGGEGGRQRRRGDRQPQQQQQQRQQHPPRQQQQRQRGGRGGNRGDRSPSLSKDQLDHQLDNFLKR